MTREKDFPGFALTIGKMFLSCGGRDVTDLLVESYWDDLCHLTLVQVKAAIPEAKALADRGFPPDAEGIRRCAEKIPSAPYHRALPEMPPAKEWTEEQKAESRALMEKMKKSLSVTETLANRQWPGFGKRGNE